MKLKQKIKNLSVILLISAMSLSCNPFGASEPKAGGVIKSVDGGKSFRFFNVVKDNPKLSLNSVAVAKLRFAPGSNSTIFAGAYESGLLKSEDAGSTWAPILSKISVFDFAVDPVDPKIIYACGVFGGRGKIVKTADGGKTWDEMYNEASSNNAVRSVVLGDRGELFGVLANGNLIESLDSGDTWKLLYNFNTKVNRLHYEKGRLYALLAGSGLYVSADAGTTFTDLTPQLKDDSFLATFKKERVSSFNQFFLAENNTILLTTNNGLYRSTDMGKNWGYTSLPLYKNDLNFYAVAQSSVNSAVIYVAAGNSLFQTQDGGKNWRTTGLPTSGFVNSLLLDPSNPNIAYGGIYISE